MISFKKFIFLIITLLSTIFFLSCNKGKENLKTSNYIISEKAPIKSTPKRIVSISPATSSILFDLESGELLIGRTDFCSYPPEIEKIPSIGGINNANLEMILSLKPDLVITSSIFTKKMFETVESANIPIISFKETNTIEGMYDIIEVLGKILNKEKRAKQIIDESKLKIEEIRIKKNKNKTPKVYYVIGYGPNGDFSAGRNTFIHEIITIAGGDNIAKNTLNWTYSREDIFSLQPDFIFIRKEDSAGFVNTHPYTNLDAVRENKVFGIESELMDLQTPRSIKAIEFISTIISL